MAAKGTRERILAVVEQRGQEVYKDVRLAFKGVKALCAATQSRVLQLAGVISGYYPWCADLSAKLKGKGWRRGGMVDLLPGCLFFTKDYNNNGSPDHVVTFLGWLDEPKLIALVYDNYSAKPHARNLGGPVWYRGKRLAYGRFAYAMLPPD